VLKKRTIGSLGLEASPLGAGVMRLEEIRDLFSPEAFELVDFAMSQGINYFDTAYFYNSGRSEEFLRRALVEKYPRDSFIIADKLPIWQCADRKEMERIFDIQMERLGVEYIDVYLLHALQKEIWKRIYNLGVLDFLDEMKRQGRIRYVGFSFHDNADVLPMIVDAYDWDIAQLQINYYDWIVHDVKQSYEFLRERSIPIIVMEPVGGGRLAKLPEEVESIFKALNPENSIPSLAIRFCASLPGVEIVLAGMRTKAEFIDNTSCFAPFVPLSKEEYAALEKGVKIIQNSGAIPCSACRYCTGDCPSGIDIPHIFQQYNDYKMFNRPISLTWAYFDMNPPSRRADKCVNCGHCTRICPQGIDVPEQLMLVHERAVLLAVFGKNADVDKMLDGSRDKTVIFFGAGAFGKTVLSYAIKREIPVEYFCDNGKELWGTEVEGIKVISPEQLKQQYDTSDAWVLITNQHAHSAIKKQLEAVGIASAN